MNCPSSGLRPKQKRRVARDSAESELKFIEILASDAMTERYQVCVSLTAASTDVVARPHCSSRRAVEHRDAIIGHQEQMPFRREGDVIDRLRIVMHPDLTRSAPGSCASAACLARIGDTQVPATTIKQAAPTNLAGIIAASAAGAT